MLNQLLVGNYNKTCGNFYTASLEFSSRIYFHNARAKSHRYFWNLEVENKNAIEYVSSILRLTVYYVFQFKGWTLVSRLFSYFTESIWS